MKQKINLIWPKYYNLLVNILFCHTLYILTSALKSCQVTGNMMVMFRNQNIRRENDSALVLLCPGHLKKREILCLVC